MGVAKLGIPFGGRAAADRISDRIGSGRGLTTSPRKASVQRQRQRRADHIAVAI